MRKLKKLLFIYVSLAMVIVLNGCSKLQGTAGTKTIMIYMIGSDLEGQYGFGSFNIDAIEKSGVDLDKTKIVFKLGGSLSWQSDEIHEDGGLYELDENYKLKEINHQKDDMCDPDTLSEFLNYGYENYKTDSYDLILWDHGGGSILGYGYDELYETTLKLTDIKAALEDSPFTKDNKLEVIGFDACLMSCVETGYVLKDHANYMIASQETIPGYGWDYSFLKDVDNKIDGESLAKAIIDHYVDFYDQISKEQNVYLDTTLSCIDLNKMDDVEKGMNHLFEKIDTSLTEESVDNSMFASLSTSRSDVKSFGKSSSYDYDLVDLGALVNELESDYPDESKTLKNSLNEMIVYEDGNVDNASGVSVYYPYENISHVSDYLEEYQRFEFADEYYRYLLNFSSIIVEGNKSENQALENAKVLAEKNEKSEKISVELSKEEAKNYARGKYAILQKVDDMKDAYMPVYWDTDLTLTDTTLTANYNNKVMTICSGDEQIVTTLIGIDSSPEYIRYQIPAIMFHYEDGFKNFKVIRSYFILHVNRQTLDVRLAGVVPADNLKSNLAAKNYIDINDYQEIQFLSTIMQVQYDKNHKPKPFREWKSTGTLQAISVNPQEKFEFKFMDISKGDFYTTLMVQDIYGNVSGSDIQKFSSQ